MTNKSKLRLLQGGSFLTIISPLAIGVAIQHEKYFETGRAWQFTIAGVMAVFIVILQAKKTFNFHRTFWELLILGFLFLFESIIGDLKLIIALILAGEAINYPIFYNKLKTSQLIENKVQEKAVDEIANEELIKRKMRGRV